MEKYLFDNNARNTVIFEKRKLYFNRLFDLALNSDKDSYDDLRTKMLAVFGDDTTFEEVENFIELMNRYAYPTKAGYIKKVLGNKKIGSPEEVEKPLFMTKQSVYFEPDENLTRVNREFRCRNLTKIMQEALKDAKEGKEVVKDKTILQNIKKDLSFLDIDLVLDYLMFLYDLKPISKDELEKLDYTLNYFKENVAANLEKFKGLDYKKEEDAKTIRELKMDGEEELDSLIKKDIGRLYTWKTRKLKNLLEYYTSYEEWIRGIIDTEEFTRPNTSKGYINKLIKEESPFIIDYYNEIGNVAKFYDTNIKSLQTVCNTKKQEVKQAFVKKLLLDNNSVENK